MLTDTVAKNNVESIFKHNQNYLAFSFWAGGEKIHGGNNDAKTYRRKSCSLIIVTWV